MKLLFIVSILLSSLACIAQEQAVAWKSDAISAEIKGTVHAATTQPAALVIYLQHLATPRLGQDADDKIISELNASGANVLVLDYASHPNAKSVALCADVLKLRKDLTKKDSPLAIPNVKVDPAKIYFLREGFRLLRDVEFARDGQRVLAMDIAYPSGESISVPLLIEFTCDNQNRMGSSSLLFCHDTLVEGAMFSGFAAAMADHPVAPPYKGLDDPMPQVIHRAKAAIRTARSLSKQCNLNGKIGVMGFSRGGPIAAILACSNGQKNLEGDGQHLDQSSDVQAALVHGNRYDYLDLLPDDPMLKRFEKAWGSQKDNADKWAAHGAMRYLKGSAAPMFLNTSDAESPEYRDGLEKLARKLESIKSEYIYQQDPDDRGHRVTEDPATLQKIYDFFHQHLDTAKD